MHGWIGLWGAALGLLFGSTGVLLNHRAVLKIPVTQTQVTMLQFALPSPAPANAKMMAEWLQHELKIDRPASRVREYPSTPVAWGDKTIRQPARWSAIFSSPRASLQAEYWAGNHFITVRRSENNLFATLTNLHKGAGAGIGWILLVDTLAGSIILLSITGVLLWSMLSRRRMIGAAIGAMSVIALIGLAMQAI